MLDSERLKQMPDSKQQARLCWLAQRYGDGKN
jgi:hypothetical protein